jgi:hypothetical protein
MTPLVHLVTGLSLVAAKAILKKHGYTPGVDGTRGMEKAKAAEIKAACTTLAFNARPPVVIKPRRRVFVKPSPVRTPRGTGINVSKAPPRKRKGKVKSNG